MPSGPTFSLKQTNSRLWGRERSSRCAAVRLQPGFGMVSPKPGRETLWMKPGEDSRKPPVLFWSLAVIHSQSERLYGVRVSQDPAQVQAREYMAFIYIFCLEEERLGLLNLQMTQSCVRLQATRIILPKNNIKEAL